MFSWLVHKQPAAKLCLSLIFLFFFILNDDDEEIKKKRKKKKNISYEIFYVEQIAMPFGFCFFFGVFCFFFF